MRSRGAARGLALAAGLVWGAPDAWAQVSTWTVRQADVRVACPLTVGGSFEARSSALTGTLSQAVPGATAFDGELRLDLAAIDTGIDLRNRHLRENYLEVQKGPPYAEAVLSSLALPDGAPGKPREKKRFTAQLLLHGVSKAIAGTAEIARLGDRAEVSARFPLRLADHSIPPPRYLGVGVRDEVQIAVSLTLDRKEGQR